MENIMNIKTRRNFFGKITAMAALLPGLELFAQQTPAGDTSSPSASKDAPRRMGGEHFSFDPETRAACVQEAPNPA